MSKKLYRSRNDRIISGVCAGLGEYFNVDPTLLRIAAVLLGFWSCGTAIVAYLVMAVIVPLAPARDLTQSSDSDAVQP